MKRMRIVNKRRFSVFMITTLSILFLTFGFLFNQIKSYGIDKKIDNQYHTVTYGETLWSIAEQYNNESRDIRDYIAETKEINNIYKSEIMPGDQLVLPEE